MTRKLYLKKSELVDITRHQKGELNPNAIRNWTDTLGHAIEYGAWDTCHGTMSCRIELHDPKEFMQRNGVQLRFSNIHLNPKNAFRPFVVVQ